ncbi:MAG: 30S ribosomal protein S3 [candidate division Zixibacteria bacterium]|nr:30S ribosomal protein S3 [candidate division Zixibacteria bacterium]
MGQKTHPVGFRLGVIKSWNSKWFAEKNFANLLEEDLLIRRYTEKRLEHAGLSRIEILRAPKRVTVDIHTAKPGVVIGRKGAEVDKLREELQLLTSKETLLNIIEVKKPELDASLVAQGIAKQLEGRISFRRAMKKAVTAAMKMGAEGIKVMCGGRLAGAEIARTEKYHQGRVPLHTLRADIDYATATARTTYGAIGVKVWICKGEVYGAMDEQAEELSAPERRPAEGKRGRTKKGEAPKRRRRRRRPKGAERGEGKQSAERSKPEDSKSAPRKDSSRGSKDSRPAGGEDVKKEDGDVNA